jgi:4-diphosphocytidyl-2-C-methyl-D-erythritol kinase
MELRSPAKINLYLKVTGKRPDGYHNLITLMCCIGLFDSLQFRFGTNQIQVTCSHPDVPIDNTNLAFRAAKLFFDASGIKEGVHIDIEKSIPVGAGLGGGSSNAASVLMSLNSHYDFPFSNDTLRLMGKSLGADVPFFIFGRPAIATGIGDVLKPFNILLSYKLLLIYPLVNISTAEVYHKMNLTLTKNKKINTNDIFKLDWERNAPKLLHNDLETAAIAICPEIQTAKEALIEYGASGALMSGSGSCVFGLFKDIDRAQQARQLISSVQQRWQLYLTHII